MSVGMERNKHVYTHLDVLGGNRTNTPCDGLQFWNLGVLKLQILVNESQHISLINNHSLL